MIMRRPGRSAPTLAECRIIGPRLGTAKPSKHKPLVRVFGRLGAVSRCRKSESALAFSRAQPRISQLIKPRRAVSKAAESGKSQSENKNNLSLARSFVGPPARRIAFRFSRDEQTFAESLGSAESGRRTNEIGLFVCFAAPLICPVGNLSLARPLA